MVIGHEASGFDLQLREAPADNGFYAGSARSDVGF